MKFIIKHEIRGRMRIHMAQSRMTCRQADMLLYYIQSLEEVTEARVYERTGDAVIVFSGDRENIIKAVKVFDYDKVTVPDGYLEHSNTRSSVNAEYREKLIMKVFFQNYEEAFSPMAAESGLCCFSFHRLYRQGNKLSGKRKAEGRGSRRHRHRSISYKKRLFNGRICYVPSHHRRASGRMDAQKVRGRSGQKHVPQRQPGMA